MYFVGLMMWKKINRILFILLGTVLFLGLLSCVEEPTIVPVERPFSVLRIGNLTTNLDEITVIIIEEMNDEDANVYEEKRFDNLAKNELTDYFDVLSGRRQVYVLNPQTGDTIFEKSIEAVSYNILSWYFTGYYHQNIDSTSFAGIYLSDGITYLGQGSTINEDSLSMVFFHASGPTDVDSVKNIGVFMEFLLKDSTVADTSTLIGTFAFGEDSRSVLRQGDYTLYFIDTANDDTLATYHDQFNDRLRNFIYITGEPKNPVIVKELMQYLAARPK